MSWRELRNAPLIEALVVGQRRMLSEPILPDGSSNRSWRATWDVLRYTDRTKLRDEVLNWIGVYGPFVDMVVCALVVYDDLPALVVLEAEELEVMRRMFPDTELDARCEAVLNLFAIIGKEKAHGLARQLLDSGPAGGVGTEEDVVAAQAAGRESAVPEGEEDA